MDGSGKSGSLPENIEKLSENILNIRSLLNAVEVVLTSWNVLECIRTYTRMYSRIY